ncbi:MAG TPA: BtaA family protein [Saprospiraceae bacterium]|nr:BtaA family protein [Saprospiraceae bacterium]
MIKPIQNYFFQQLHSNKLLYNTCWEDPRCDKALLEIDQNSEIVMITSAGCNALDYLIEEPSRIYCVDMNARQNALLELKKAFYVYGDYSALFDCFGHGKKSEIKAFYINNLRHHLPEYAQKYWDKHIYYFNGKGVRKSFYFHGASGLLAYIVKNYLQSNKQLNQHVDQFFKASTLEQQVILYQKIDEQFWTKIMAWLMNRHMVLSLAGVPKSQQQLFADRYENGASDFMKYCMNQVFTQVPVQDNYFWQLYYNGLYTKDCCPAYLEKDHFPKLRKNVEKLQAHTTTMSDFLKRNPGHYSHFVLLDHQDWLAENDKEALNEEWELILKNSKKGTRILMRSAAEAINFFPDFVLKKVTFQEELAKQMHLKDRVGTYASTYLGIVN